MKMELAFLTRAVMIFQGTQCNDYNKYSTEIVDLNDFRQFHANPWLTPSNEVKSNQKMVTNYNSGIIVMVPTIYMYTVVFFTEHLHTKIRATRYSMQGRFNVSQWKKNYNFFDSTVNFHR